MSRRDFGRRRRSFSGSLSIIAEGSSTLGTGGSRSELGLVQLSQYPVARAMVRDVAGSEGIFVYVSYAGTNTWTNPKNTGQIHGNQSSWTLVTPVNLQPINTTGWQPGQITLLGGGSGHSDFQLYDLYLDPRMVG